ncbi:hypothetical protein CCAX7_008510 [Capsulimonas corticalis]|uniref:Uncharacterized protein n=1 Tax=Capsulimonas corticalis TaxID=2219043 RepID=A0A402CTZ6_9BACT|nr:DUF4276 family protein [Capsulimonas corticalis]BDI28800.1 hypothetical protein CCAX7_008510 [Capsulimonas corticalis]
MTRLLIHVEGETEETFVNELLADHLYRKGYTAVSARLLGNSRQRSRRGGIRSWRTVRGDILRHLKEDPNCLATTMVDYYALPQGADDGWPGRHKAAGLAFFMKAASVEEAVAKDIIANTQEMGALSRFFPFVMMHEFEAMLFSDCERFASGVAQPGLASAFQTIRDQFSSPEEINDSPITAPSKRIEGLVPGYVKPLYGTLAALEIGLDAIRAQCPHFRSWLEQLESWPERRASL